MYSSDERHLVLDLMATRRGTQDIKTSILRLQNVYDSQRNYMSSSFVPNPAVILSFFIITSGSGRENQTFFAHKKCELSISQ